jgi:hypothetical protein
VSNDVFLTLHWLIARAELMGSRGRARHFGTPEPEGSDYDWVIYTDGDQQPYAEAMRFISMFSPDFVTIRRPHGMTLHNRKAKIDVSVYPTWRRALTHEAWALIQSGVGKDEAWAEVEGRHRAGA